MGILVLRESISRITSQYLDSGMSMKVKEVRCGTVGFPGRKRKHSSTMRNCVLRGKSSTYPRAQGDTKALDHVQMGFTSVMFSSCASRARGMVAFGPQQRVLSPGWSCLSCLSALLSPHFHRSYLLFEGPAHAEEAPTRWPICCHTWPHIGRQSDNTVASGQVEEFS